MTSQAAIGETTMATSDRNGARSWRSRVLQMPVLVSLGGLALMTAGGVALSLVLVTAAAPDSTAVALISVWATFAALYGGLVLLVRIGTKHRRPEELEVRMTELRAGYDAIVEVLCSALDLRDNVTQGHARRIAERASVVAWQMGLRKEQVRQIEKAAILHDIGKIGVADAVLSKTGPLDESEWDEMKRHPEVGYRIVKNIAFLNDAADIVHSHHERWDGKGYPSGLRGEDIPIGARIFAVVDAYNAMISHRPYRKAMPRRKAIEEVVRNANSQFDPNVVRAFLDAYERGLLDGEAGDEGEPSAIRRGDAALSQEAR